MLLFYHEQNSRFSWPPHQDPTSSNSRPCQIVAHHLHQQFLGSSPPPSNLPLLLLTRTTSQPEPCEKTPQVKEPWKWRAHSRWQRLLRLSLPSIVAHLQSPKTKRGRLDHNWRGRNSKGRDKRVLEIHGTPTNVLGFLLMGLRGRTLSQQPHQQNLYGRSK